MSASLGLAFGKGGPEIVAVLGRSMVIGSIALYVYGAACVMATKREKWPVWLSAFSAWFAWFAAAFGGLGAASALGTLR